MTKSINDTKNRQKGFTLIELMIVVAIIGILAAISIPSFLQYQLKSKSAEARANIRAMRICQETFKAENDYYTACTTNPATVSAQGTRQAWVTPDPGDGWREIGYQPSANLYYSYGIAIGGTIANDDYAGIAAANLGSGYSVTAAANLDTIDDQGEFGYGSDTDRDGSIDVDFAGNALRPIPDKAIRNIVDMAPGQF